MATMATTLVTPWGRAFNGGKWTSTPGEKTLTSGSFRINSRRGKVTVRSSRLPEPPASSAEVGAGDEREEESGKRSSQGVSRRWAAIVGPIATTMGAAMGAAIGEEEDEAEGRVELRTLGGCGLGVARYPDFAYNAEGGGGAGRAWRSAGDGATTRVRFEPAGLRIPRVDASTASILGVPLPPGLRIEVVPRSLAGVVDRRSGVVELDLLADFCFTAGPLYRAPPLVVAARLTTEAAEGAFRGGRGRRLDAASGDVTLVAVARLAPVHDAFLDSFLTLPTDCLARLSANLSFS